MRTPFRLVALGLLAVSASALALAGSRYIVGQSYTFQGRLERGQVTDPSFYLSLPCGGGPGSGTSRHSFSFRLEKVEHGPDVAAVFNALQPGQSVEATGAYRGLTTVPGVPSAAAQPTLTCEKLTPLPLPPRRVAQFDRLYELRRQ